MRFPSCTERARKVCSAHFSCFVIFFLAALACGCAVEPGATGAFEQALKVDGPVRLDVINGSGEIEIAVGPVDQVHIHGEYRVRALLFGSTQRRAENLRAKPPVEQSGNVITIGRDTERLRNVTINYRITVPQVTSLSARAGSGNIEVHGIKGPARLTTGSGNITAGNIGDEVEASAGSGNIQLSDVAGTAVANAGSGDMELRNVRGAIRTRTGSGEVTLSRPGDRVQVTTGSGDVRITEAISDVRITTGSGDVTITGNPSAQSYWDLRASSGEISVDVPQSASFRLYARTTSGSIETDIPLTIEEQSRRSLRARVGRGDARIEAETSSGSIRIR